MTHEEFKMRLSEAGLTLVQFAEKIETPYNTVSKYGKAVKVPQFVNSYLDLYMENKELKNVKQQIKELAAKL